MVENINVSAKAENHNTNMSRFIPHPYEDNVDW